MRRFPHSLYCICALILLTWQVATAQSKSVTAGTTELVRSAFDAGLAFDTVAYLDQFVRWPGNRGFDASIDHIAARLEAAGYIKASEAQDGDRLTYRVEEYPMEHPAWEPLGASLTIVGQAEPILQFSNNRNMLARRSHSTPAEGVTAQLVYAGDGSVASLDALQINGKIVLVDGEIDNVFAEAVTRRGAAGLLSYSLPSYLKPQLNKHSVQFRGIPRDVAAHESWAISLSTDAREKLLSALDNGEVAVTVMTGATWTENAVERTVVADIRGGEVPGERFVFSAHVQEPGANDNASGVGAQLEMARVAAELVNSSRLDPKRSITFLWGLEMTSTARYVEQNADRAQGIRWGLSLDMVGEDTNKTGGTFLIEKMPDPSAIWTRGEDRHTEWGGDVLTKEDMTPHYFNDLVLGRALEQAATNGWVVKTNPFEGGSDHVPFLRADIPGLLLWHFTDQFYHTDRDRLEMVSRDELKNVGVTALTTAIALTTADRNIAGGLIRELRDRAMDRLAAEMALSLEAIENGSPVAKERDIIETWAGWYDQAIAAMDDIEVGGSSAQTALAIQDARNDLRRSLTEILKLLAQATPGPTM